MINLDKIIETKLKTVDVDLTDQDSDDGYDIGALISNSFTSAYSPNEIPIASAGLSEQTEEDEEPELQTQPTDTMGGGQQPSAEYDPNQMGGQFDQSQMGGAYDPNMGMGGMGTDPSQYPERSKFNIGRNYELKRVFQRLLILKDFLSDKVNPIALRLNVHVTTATELFKLVVDNFESFDDKQIDEIIVLFYKFIKTVYIILKAFYKRESELHSKKASSWDKILKLTKISSDRFKDMK